MSEEKTVLDLAVDALSRLADSLKDISNTLYAMGYVEVEIQKDIAAMKEDIKALLEHFSTAKEIVASEQPVQAEQPELEFEKPFITEV